MSQIKVVIADDSVVYRSQIRAALGNIANVKVVAVASNGRLAIERLLQENIDLLILDIEMPEMNGVETLKQMKAKNIQCKVLVFSSVTKRGSEATLEALSLGASDFVTKPDAQSLTVGGDPTIRIQELLEPKINALFSFTSKQASVISEAPIADKKSYPSISWDLVKPKVLLIGSSTGGPTALDTIFSQLKGPFNCPILIAQHMPPIFTASLAERLQKISGAPAKEASNGEVLLSGTIYVAPGNYHMRVKKTASNTILTLDQGPQVNSVRPAVDLLFESAAPIYKESALAVILTGMGHDGLSGVIAVKENRGAVLIQNKESSVVFGMPGAVFDAGAYDKIADLSQIANLLAEKICSVQINKMAAGA